MIYYVDWKSQSEDRQRKKKSDRRRKEEALNMRREGSGEKAQGNKRRTYASVGGLKKTAKKVLKPCRDTKRTKIPEREERASETQQEGWLREAGEDGDAKPVRLSAAPMSRWRDQ